VTGNERLVIPEDVVHRMVGEEAVLLQLDSGVYYGLDPVGSRIWELLATHGSIPAVCETMAEEYEVAPSQLEQDVRRLVKELQTRGLVAVAPG
jgi:hypothetical protein